MTESEFARCYMTHIVLPQAQNRGEQGRHQVVGGIIRGLNQITPLRWYCQE